MSDGREEAEERQRLVDKYLYMCQIAEDSARELMERDKMLSGAFNRERDLQAKIHRPEHYIDNIATMIDMQLPLKERDHWLADMIDVGLYKPDTDGD